MAFHACHSKSIKLTMNGQVAHRQNKHFFTHGLLFTQRAIETNEKIHLKLLEIHTDLGGFIYIGFTRRNPQNYNLINNKKMSPSINEMGSWCWVLPQPYCKSGNILSFHYDANGQVWYDLNGIRIGKFDGTITKFHNVWGLVSFYGNLHSVQILNELPLNLRQQLHFKYQPKQLHFSPLHINQAIHGRFVELVQVNRVRRMNFNHEGVFFTRQSVKPKEMIAMKIVPFIRNEQMMNFDDEIHLDLGLTALNPAMLSDVPNVHSLVNRPEYWVLINDADAFKLRLNDELNLFLNGSNGEIRVFLNGTIRKIVHVDHTVDLWLFGNIAGTNLLVIECGISCNFEMKKMLDDGKMRQMSNERECCVCFDHIVDCALIQCGCVCMCYGCALQQWVGQGKCPFCRSHIDDVVQV